MADNVFAVLGKGKVKDRGQGPLSKKEQRKVAAARQAALNFVEAAASSSAAAPEAADPGTPGRERLNEAVGTPRSTRSDDNDDAEFATHFASLSGRSRAPAAVQTPAHAVQSHRPAVQLTTLAVQPRASPGRSPARASSPDAQPQASARSIPVGRASSPQPPAASAQMPRWQASHLPEQPPAAAAQLRPQSARPAPAMGLHTSSTPFTGRISAQHRELQSAANSTDEQRLSAAIAAASDFVEGRANVHRHDEVAALRTLLRDARLRLRSLREAPLPTISPTLPRQPVVRPGMGQPPPGMSHPLMNQPHVSQQQQQGPPRPVWPPFMQASPANTPPPLYQGPPRPPQVGPVGQVGPRPPPPAFPLPNRPRPPAYLAGAQGMPRPPMPYPRPPAPYHTPPPPSYNPSANTSNLPIHRPGPPRPPVSPPRPPAARLPQTLNPTTYPTAGSGGGDSYLDDEDDENCCVVCMEMPKQMLFVPCGHMVCCQTCSGKIAAQQPALCPFCRTHILDTVLPE